MRYIEITGTLKLSRDNDVNKEEAVDE